MKRINIIISGGNMERKAIWSWVAVTLFFAAGVAADTELKLSQPLAATLKVAACLHDAPAVDAPEVICLDKGAPLTLVARMKAKATVNGSKGYWYKAEIAGGAVGWVFGTDVEIAAGPDDCSECPGRGDNSK
jgi:hypothetical protein